MVNLFFILTTLGLLASFFVLVGYEERRGIRVFASARTRFDQQVARFAFIIAHVDFGAFFLDEMHRFGVRFGHDVAHISLLVVRATERLLTRAIRHLRTRRSVDVAPREDARGYVKTLSDFKGRLKATQSEVPDIQ